MPYRDLFKTMASVAGLFALLERSGCSSAVILILICGERSPTIHSNTLVSLYYTMIIYTGMLFILASILFAVGLLILSVQSLRTIKISSVF